MSTLNVSNITDGTTTVETSYVLNGSAKAWVRYDQILITINTSFNVSSTTDVATGDSDVNFTASLNSTNHPAPTNQSFSSSEMGVYSYNDSAGSTRVVTRSNSSTNVDRAYNLAQLGDLA